MSENGLHKIPAMRATLVAIQELHTALLTGFSARSGPLYECTECGQAFPCDTRKLADEALGEAK